MKLVDSYKPVHSLTPAWMKRVENTDNENADGVKLDDCANFRMLGIQGWIQLASPPKTSKSNKASIFYRVTAVRNARPGTDLAKPSDNFGGDIKLELKNDAVQCVTLEGEKPDQSRENGIPKKADREQINKCIVKLVEYVRPGVKKPPSSADLQKLPVSTPLDVTDCAELGVQGKIAFVEPTTDTPKETKTVRYEVTKVGKASASDTSKPFTGQVAVGLVNGLVRVLSEEGAASTSSDNPLTELSDRDQINSCIVGLVAQKLSIGSN